MHFKNVREQVSDRLREDVLLGKFKSGEVLREAFLVDRFKVSRGPIREALLQLSLEGLLESVPNRGVRVGEVWTGELVPVMVGIRFDLECFAIDEVVRNTPEGFFDVIRRNLRLFRLACEDNDMSEAIKLELRFHRLIIRASEQPGLEPVWLSLQGGMCLSYARPEILDENYNEHSRIVDALEKGDSNAAKAALKKIL